VTPLTNHLIVQPRVLARTEIVRRFVVENDLGQDAVIKEDDEKEEVALSDHQRENLRFWTGVLQDYSFSDVDVEVPGPTREATLYIKVRNSGYGDWGLWFGGYLYRSSPLIGCYLARREGIPSAVRIYERIQGSLEDLRHEIGDDLACWSNAKGRPGIGFRREAKLPFVSGENNGDDFREAVSWMRDHLDRLVSALHPRVERMLATGD
jgi:hypothetical protein